MLIAEAEGPSAPPHVRYGYDEDGNRSRVVYPSGMEVVYELDYAGRAASAAASGGGPTFVGAATYQPFGPLSRLQYGNGTVREVEHDARYRLTTNRLVGPGGALAWFAYQYDGAGNVLSIEDELNSGFDRAFGYDDLGRLVRADTGASLWGTGSYSYDAIGNVQQVQLGTSVLRTFSYLGTTPKLTSVTDGGVSYTVGYDAAGNTTRQQGAAYAYSERGLLRGPVADPGEPGESLLYDARGVRVLWGYETGPGTSEGRSHLYDTDYRLLGSSSWEEPEDPGASTEDYEVVWFAGFPVASVRGSGPVGGPMEVTTRWTLTDRLGTALLQTDGAGAVSWWGEYEPYGQVFATRAGNPQDQPLRFPGQEAAELATASTIGNYNVHRWYQSQTGRYPSPDPIRSVREIWPFGYARQNPIRYFDTTGLFSIDSSCDEPLASCTIDRRFSSGSDQLRREVNFACHEQRLSMIADMDLQSCMRESCRSGTIACNGPACKGTTRQGYNVSPYCEITRNATLCIENWGSGQVPPGAMGFVVFHEWGHGCGRERYQRHDPFWNPLRDPGRREHCVGPRY